MPAVPHASVFGSVADLYERGRPGYPPEAIDRLAAELGLGEESTVLDLAAGTGKLTRDLTGRFARVIAVEPLPQMVALLKQAVAAAEAIEASAEAIPLPPASVDGVLVAQAFHWFAGERTLAEIARILRPEGGLGLLWNSTPWEERAGPWFAAIDDVLERSRADLTTLHRHASGIWKDVFTAQSPFEPLASAAYPNPRRVSPPELLAALGSRSYVAAMDEADRMELLGEVEALIGRPDAPMEAGELIVPMRTDVYWTHLRR